VWSGQKDALPAWDRRPIDSRGNWLTNRPLIARLTRLPNDRSDMGEIVRDQVICAIRQLIKQWRPMVASRDADVPAPEPGFMAGWGWLLGGGVPGDSGEQTGIHSGKRLLVGAVGVHHDQIMTRVIVDRGDLAVVG